MAIVVTSSVSPRLVAGKRVSAPRRAAAKVGYISSMEPRLRLQRGRGAAMMQRLQEGISSSS